MMTLVQNQSTANPIQARKRMAQIVQFFVRHTLVATLRVFLVVCVQGFSENNEYSQIRFFRHLYYYYVAGKFMSKPMVGVFHKLSAS